MKTIQISDGLWKRLKLESVERAVPMRDIIEEMGSLWVPARTVDKVEAVRETLRSLQVKELTVDLSE